MYCIFKDPLWKLAATVSPVTTASLPAIRYKHRRSIETEAKANCRCFRLGGKIECRTGNLWLECVALCTQLLYIFPLLLLGGLISVDLQFFLYRFNFHQKCSETAKSLRP